MRMNGRMIPRLLAGAVAVVGLIFAVLTPAAADVDPPMVDATLHPGESLHIEKSVDVPDVPPRLDFCLLVDLSGSYTDDLPNIKAKDDDIFDALKASVPDLELCTASFVDYPIGPYGSAASGDYAYKLDQDLTSSKATWTAANSGLATKIGGDTPESQYTALHQIATGAGIDVTANCPGFGAANVAAGQNASWRSGATHVVGITTDAPFHNPGDASGNCPAGGYPGPSQAATLAELAIPSVKVIAIKAPGSGGQMDAVAAATGGAVVSTGSTSAEIADAILEGIAALTFDITAEPVGCDPLDITFAPDVHEDVAGPATVVFEEWIEVPADVSKDDLPEDGKVHCTVEFKADGGVIGVQEIWITVPLVEFLLIDEDSIDNGTSTIEDISFNAPFCGAGDPSVCVNDDIADPGVRAPLFTDITPFSGLVLPTGEIDDEGLFRLTLDDPQVSLQNDATFTIAELMAATGAAADENNLDKVDGVAPLGAADIADLEGKTFCALVYDSDISVDVSDGYGSLKGATLGLAAFKVTAIGPDPDGPEGSVLPSITIDILDVSETCAALGADNGVVPDEVD